MALFEAELRGALRAGEFDGLTLWPTSKGWQANARRKGRSSCWHVQIDDDPIVAIRRALQTDKLDAEAEALI